MRDPGPAPRPHDRVEAVTRPLAGRTQVILGAALAASCAQSPRASRVWRTHVRFAVGDDDELRVLESITEGRDQLAAVMSRPRSCFACEPGKEGGDFTGAVEVYRAAVSLPTRTPTPFNGGECIPSVTSSPTNTTHAGLPKRSSTSRTIQRVASPLSQCTFGETRGRVARAAPHLATGEKRRAALDARFGVRSQRVGNPPEVRGDRHVLVLESRPAMPSPIARSASASSWT